LAKITYQKNKRAGISSGPFELRVRF